MITRSSKAGGKLGSWISPALFLQSFLTSVRTDRRFRHGNTNKDIDGDHTALLRLWRYICVYVRYSIRKRPDLNPRERYVLPRQDLF
ncbi:uncharacterized protein F4807DRAFT_291727 [Annulohypoxylon truncatum]|uniref:uncharacterized protein n=1 Tax=Annulohypoxylon truncatum TaxID=327061 RepID=UPI002007C259|nr:uncharacterized protein F4807DRAFT_291727 [Annulohypoxylon truncatum]KAI1205256.1 hypothetical protein F4807DRAFT_291727 [Annulohypoxylon truncatum]